MSFKRQRTEELLLSFLAVEVRKLADPRLELITLTAAEMSPDLKHATIYWSVLTLGAAPDATGAEPAFPSDARIHDIDDALKGATYMLKRRIGSELELRYVPQLNFRYDSSFENASRIDTLVKKALS
ncbi:MAG: ribosome-binding factor A [Bdellovibrionota bacterium]